MDHNQYRCFGRDGYGEGCASVRLPGVQTQVVNHAGQVPTSAVTFNNVDAAALNTYIKVGTPAGPWIPGVNDCNTWANQAISNSTPQYSIYGVPITYATGVVVYADGSIHQPGGN